MVGETLTDLRRRIEALADENGRYYVACGRTGDRPIPVVDKRFPDRVAARRAARAADRYRSTLRRYDSQVPYYDLIVRRQPDRDARTEPTRDHADPGAV